VKAQHDLERKLSESGSKKEAIGKRMELILLEEKFLDYHLKEGSRVQDTCHSEFDGVIPVLNKAVTGL
jgi:hypothetical protein